MASNPIQDWLDLMSEQQWRTRPCKDGGYLCFPPADKVRPGYEQVKIPGLNQSRLGGPHMLDNVRSSLRRAGLQFEEEKAVKKTEAKPTLSLVGEIQASDLKPIPPTDPFAAVRFHVNAINDHLAAIDELMDEIKRAGEAVSKETAGRLQKLELLEKAFSAIVPNRTTN